MPVDWNLPLVARNGRPATLLPRDGWQDRVGDKRHRVSIMGDWATERGIDWPTTFLFSDEGRCRADGGESEFDVVNAAAAMSEAA